MSITSIARNFNGDPNIVTILTTNTLTEITTLGYLTSSSISADIELLQNGEFQWNDSDLVLIKYDVDIGFFVRNSATNAFVALNPSGGLSSTLASGTIFVGNVSNIAQGVPMSGDGTIDNAGIFSISNLAVTLAKLSLGIAPSHIIKFAGQLTTSGGTAAEAFSVPGALAASDMAY